MRALAMRPCPLLLPMITTRSAYALSLRHICRLEDNDLVNNETDYSGVDAFGASLATNGRLRVFGCAAVLRGLRLGFSSNTLCANCTRGYLTLTPPFTCVTSTSTFPSSLVCSSAPRTLTLNLRGSSFMPLGWRTTSLGLVERLDSHRGWQLVRASSS